MENRFRKTKPTKSVWLSRKEERSASRRRRRSPKWKTSKARWEISVWKSSSKSAKVKSSARDPTRCGERSDRESASEWARRKKKERKVGFWEKRSLAEEEEVKKKSEKPSPTPQKGVCVFVNSVCVRACVEDDASSSCSHSSSTGVQNQIQRFSQRKG